MAVEVNRTRTASVPRSNGSTTLGRLTTETKNAFKTTEFWAMVALIVGILIAAWVVGDDGDSGSAGGNGGDAFSASRAWLYVAIVGAAYMVSRGLAKAGSSEPYWADRDDMPNRSDD